MMVKREDVQINIVDDEFPVRDALSMLIKTIGLDVNSYGSASAFLQNYNPEQPSCLVLDVRMPDMDGIELQKELARRNIDIPIIFMSGHGDVPITAKAFRAGAIDFIEKPFDNKLLLNRIEETVNKVQTCWQERCKKNRSLEGYAHLTERESEVMKLIVNNHTNKEAAKILGISHRTVDVHRAHIMEKMQAESLSVLILKAVECEIL